MNLFRRLREFFLGLWRSKAVADKMAVRYRVPEDMMGLISVWQDVYMGSMDENSVERVSGLASLIANNLAKTAMSELVIRTSLSGEQDYDTGLFDLDEMINLRQQIEYAIAMGGVLMRPYVNPASGEVVLAWYTADRVIPVEWRKRTMTGCVLIDYYVMGSKSAGNEKLYIKLESHGFDPADGMYHIRTKLFQNNSLQSFSLSSVPLENEIPLSEAPVEEWRGITPDVSIGGLDGPLFVYIGTPFANNKAFDNPLGVSIFKDALPWIAEFDEAFKSAKRENKQGRTKLFVSDSMIPQKKYTSSDGKAIVVDDLSALDAELIKRLETERSQDLFEQWAPTLRFDSFITYMNFLLHTICILCGLDPGQYVFDEKSYAVTAKEIISKQQATYKTVRDVQNYMITPAVERIIKAVRSLQYLYGLEAIPENLQVVMDYGDSILTDEQQEKQDAMAEVTSGLRSKKSYLMTIRHLTEEEADAELTLIEQDSKASMPVYAPDGLY